jgi:preprotein translocase subunit SecD
MSNDSKTQTGILIGLAGAMLLCAVVAGGGLYFWLQAADFDAVGGVEVVVDVDLSDVPPEAVETTLSLSEEVLEQRLKRFGARGARVDRAGDGLRVQIPAGTDKIEQAVRLMASTLHLEFRLVQQEEWPEPRLRALVETAGPDATPATVNGSLKGQLPAGFEILFEPSTSGGGTPLLVSTDVILDGGDVASASRELDSFNVPYVRVVFTDAGSEAFCRVSGESVGRRLAIVLDDRISSAPVIQEAICGGVASVTMGASSPKQSYADAGSLAVALQAGSLPTSVSIGSVKDVAPAP